MIYTVQDLVEAVQRFQEVSLPPALRKSKGPASLYELTKAKNQMFEIAAAMVEQAARETIAGIRDGRTIAEWYLEASPENRKYIKDVLISMRDEQGAAGWATPQLEDLAEIDRGLELEEGLAR